MIAATGELQLQSTEQMLTTHSQANLYSPEKSSTRHVAVCALADTLMYQSRPDSVHADCSPTCLTSSQNFHCIT